MIEPVMLPERVQPSFCDLKAIKLALDGNFRLSDASKGLLQNPDSLSLDRSGEFIRK